MNQTTNRTSQTEQARATSSREPADTLRIYVACLASYNAGILHGEWIDAVQDLDEVQEAIQDMLNRSPEPGAEEFAIHDFEGFGSAELSEFEAIADVVALAGLIDEWGAELASVVWAHTGGDLDEATSLLQEHYQGCFDDLAQWAEQLLDETGDLLVLPERLRYYFDYEAYGRDAELSGDIFSVDSRSGTHIFWSR